VPCLNNARAQAVKIHSGASRDVCLGRLASSDVRQAEASFPADKARGELSRATEDLLSPSPYQRGRRVSKAIRQDETMIRQVKYREVT
jgi:Ni/Co efflux regulator RcnB